VETLGGENMGHVTVIVLADVSGSMYPNELEDKIGVLNRGMAAMLSNFAELDSLRGPVSIGVVAFGGEKARLHLPVCPARHACWTDMTADGRTPMGDAFGLTRKLLDDPAVVPGHGLPPVLILVSDGGPTDDWAPLLDELLASRRGVTALRVAIAIGTDRTPDAEEVLAAFSSPEIGVLRAEQAEEIPGLLQRVTETVMRGGA
jgi:uncharacterized protein YegL